MDSLFYLLTTYDDHTAENQQIKGTLKWLFEEIYVTNKDVVEHMNIIKEFTHLRHTKQGRIVLYNTINDLKENAENIYNEVYELTTFLLDTVT